MNITSPDNSACSNKITPVYLIQNQVVNLAQPYVITTSSSQTDPKPVSENLKSFYESSGNLDGGLLCNNDSVCKPRILKKQSSTSLGNKLKIASFLVPNKNNTQESTIISNSAPVSNVVVKPTTTTANINKANATSILNIDRKIVKLKYIPSTRNIPVKTLPKSKPIENVINSNSSIPINVSKPKLTSVQLLKLGETYHSLNQLSDGQMKIVNHALKIFNDPAKIPLEPTYDPVTNTRFIYKVVSPKDLTIVGKNKIVIKQNNKKKPYNKKEVSSKSSVREPQSKDENVVKAKVTRSGRIVKLPKQIISEETVVKLEPREPDDIDCCEQCCEEVKGIYNLQNKSNDVSSPNKIQSSLFNYLLAIVKNGTNEDRASIFIQQLEQLVVKLKLLLPCLLKQIEGVDGKECLIADDVSRIFDINPGSYHLNMDALYCEKDSEGYCQHNPKINEVQSNTSQINNMEEIEDCARVKPVDQWPPVKRLWKPKKNVKTPKSINKKIRMASECNEQVIELAIDDSKITQHNEIGNHQNIESSISEIDSSQVAEVTPSIDPIDEILNTELPVPVKPEINTQEIIPQRGSHEFYSTHFDIRSSPIKPTSTVFHKFQINFDKLSKEAQIIAPPVQNETQVKEVEIPQDLVIPDGILQLPEIFKGDMVSPCKNTASDISQVLNFDDPKDCTLNTPKKDLSQRYSKTDSLINSVLQVSNDGLEKPQESDIVSHDNLLVNQGQSVLNFLDTLSNDCLSYPETEIRHNAIDFQLDLFSFHNS